MSEEELNEPTENNETKTTNSKFRKLGSKILTAVGTKASQLKGKIDAHQEQSHENKRNTDLFNKESIGFTAITGNPSIDNIENAFRFRGIKSMQDSSLLVLKSVQLKSGTIIVSQEGNFRITDVDSMHEIDFPLDGSSPYPIKCYKCRYEIYIPSSPSTINQTQNQSIIVHGDNNGDITQVAKQQSDLEEIENAINSFKPNLLQKKKKQEALELYGNFKNCIINKKKDEGLFSKFLDVLKVVAPAAIALAQSLISALS